MKIRVKLLAGFLSVAVLCGAVGVIGAVQLGGAQASISQLAGETVPTIDNLGTIITNLEIIIGSVTALGNPLAADNEELFKDKLADIAAGREAYAKAIADIDAKKMTAEEARLWKEFKDSIPPARDYNNSLVALVEKVHGLKAGAAVEAAEPPAASPGKAPAAAARPRTPSLQAQRDAIYAQIYQIMASDQANSIDVVIDNIYKVKAYDEQHYAKDLANAAIASAKASTILMIVMAFISLSIAVVIGLLLGNGISRSLVSATTIIGKVAEGDASVRMSTTSKDEFATVASSINMLEDNINALISDISGLSKAAIEGKLSVRADASKHQGDYRKVIEGVNETLDAVITPLNMAANYVDQIAKGAIPAKITDSYSGDFNLIKSNLNLCIDSINALITDTTSLVQSAVEGRLSNRADAAKHQGDYRKIIEGINQTLDLVITPINEMTGVLKHLADGDLTVEMAGDYRGDFDILKSALNASLASFNEILGQVATAVEQVNAGSLQVSQASQALSQGATEQASSLEEITSSITEVSGQTRLNTENVVQVNGLAKTARQSAEQGNVQMRDLVAAMSDINKSAEEIRKIVKTIDDISFQINLLALNANVEAARAGKYGKGFAVVAEEVRNLAVRSANSVKETTRMVDEVISNIGRGNGLVDVTAKQLADIVDGSAKVANLAEEVSVASKEQAIGLEQITTGLGQIDQVTQSNTASAEESAAAAEELTSQAQQLRATLGRFRIKAAEGKVSNAEVIQLLKAELAKQAGSRSQAAPSRIEPSRSEAAAAKPARKTAITNPAELISLDDDNFGKF